MEGLINNEQFEQVTDSFIDRVNEIVQAYNKREVK